MAASEPEPGSDWQRHYDESLAAEKAAGMAALAADTAAEVRELGAGLRATILFAILLVIGSVWAISTGNPWAIIPAVVVTSMFLVGLLGVFVPSVRRWGRRP